MKCLHVGRWVCLMAAAASCWSRAEPDEGAPGAEGVEAIESIDAVDGEAFSQIWGSSDDLWVVGGPVLPSGVQSAEQVPAIQYCGPGRWDARVVVRRNTGDGWRDMHVPATTSLTSLHGSDASNVWAVGLDGAAVQFDGNGWVEHDVRKAAGLELDGDAQCSELSLHSVFALGANDVWAVGFISPSVLGPGLILHYDGATWTRQPTGAGDGFFGVWAESESDAWAVGSSGLSYHFDGTSWKPADAKTSQYLYSVWGTSAGDVWATGNLAVTTRFNGNEWAVLQPERDYEATRSLTGSAATGLWALTTRNTTKGWSSQALLHWADGSWQERASFTEANDALGDLWVTPEGEVWGVGRNIVQFR
jgi:hypothetical protein